MTQRLTTGLDTATTVPDSWRVVRNSALFRERREKNRPELEMYSVTQSKGVVAQSSLENRVTAPSEDRSGYNRICPDDFVYNKMRMWQGAVGVAPAEGIVSTAYVVMTPRRGVNSRYYEYLYRSPEFIAESGRFSYGLCDDMNSLRAEHFKTMLSPAPPPEVQDRIVGYLDSETARIDTLIDRKQRFIDLLLEKRTALITHAVTKGLDPDVEIKDSGIEWIGQVPSHWTTGRLKDLAPYVTSGSRGWAQYYADEGPLFLRITNLPRGGAVDLLTHDLRHVDVPPGAEGARTQVRQGDVLISITAEMGAVAAVPSGLDEAYVSQHVALVRPISSVDSRWLAFVMASQVGCQHYENRLYGGTKIQLSLDDVRETPIPIPPAAEAVMIREYLDGELRKMSALAEASRRSIDLLREYRTALISAAVTGQFDIPGTDASEEVA